MGKALYRKYRSKSLSEIVGQEHITQTLTNSLKNNSISHAYLFTGPHGVGKTSIARILAHDVNGFEYDESKTYLDIIEIDAASNRRIDEIRDLREKVHNAPTQGKYKVYIIDEVHMLTKEAFNALLKTLEEPPAHAIFILATTEAHKLPETIISRTQRYTFKPVEHAKAVAHLKHIAKNESVTIQDDAIKLIANHGKGSFRDSISLLDQLSKIDGEITVDHVRGNLGIANDQLINDLIIAIADQDSAHLSSALASLQQQGALASQTVSQLAAQLRTILIDQSATSMTHLQVCSLLKQLIEVPASNNPSAMLEVVLFEALYSNNQALQHRKKSDLFTEKEKPSNSANQPPTPKTPTKAKSFEEPKKTLDTPKKKPAKSIESKKNEPQQNIEETAKPTTAANSSEMWKAVMQDLKKSYNTLYSVVRMAEITLDDGSVELVVEFPFHQRRLNDNKNKRIIMDLIEKHSGSRHKLSSRTGKAKLRKPVKNESSAKSTPKNGAIENVTNIFGGGEVLD